MSLGYVSEPNFEKRGGLVPVVAQDIVSREVLMLAYANKEAWLNTLWTRKATYFSTSRNELWVKGETSGNTQEVYDILVDCDGDALIYLVAQFGAACHTGAETCFYRSCHHGVRKGMLAPMAGASEELPSIRVEMDPHFHFLPMRNSPLVELEGALRKHVKDSSVDESYTKKLLDQGTPRCAKKLGEEAIELALAALGENREHTIKEAADVVYHLLVLLLSCNISFADVEAELRRRKGTSGLAEKAARSE